MSRLRAQHGMALTELLAAIVVAGIVLGAAVTGFVSYLGQSAKADNTANAQDAARLALDQMAIQLRSAMSDSTVNNQPIESFGDYSLVWLAPSPTANLSSNPQGLLHIRYCLDMSTATNEKLWLQTAPFNGNTNRNWPNTAACPSNAWPTKVQVAANLVNQLQNKPLFVTPTDASGNATDVNVTALVDADPNTAPPATELRTSVTLRNLNHTPTAGLTCQAGQNGHALCDASISTDSDGQTLTYGWSMDGTLLTETSYRLDKSSLVSGSNHTFAVTVTDPGGLSATASQSLRMP
ncbi:MAG: hypothetical protein QOG41_1424 [Thermoleophilaceae bacterium]|jgi:prepilin-type N-terminal cleavage/methylation domain-containing protein|nr:hypothetical protein [Thermoleophilaceae bacterium]MEA2349616.1 hypothetical protein [Thermoleophilaceae bacterium]MEA2368160.1 hypothetical protein [Thermoleophilaceae bacterium]MEA2388651.1 hypothetical protein [Thermoleophilaceae bacterium]